MTEVRSYHGQPVLKQPVWTWEIPCYFFAGGLAGASAGLAYLSELRGNEVLARRAWAAALLGIGVSPALLTSDLGRPARFLNMLRMVKVTSPMSVGSWILSASGCRDRARGRQRLDRTVPARREGRPPGGGGARPAALDLHRGADREHRGSRLARGPRHAAIRVRLRSSADRGRGRRDRDASRSCRPARRLALGGAVLEVGLTEAMTKQLGEHGVPYRKAAASRFGRIGQVCVAAGATLLATRGGGSRGAAIGAGALLSAGALSVRWSVFKAGFQSSADPKYVVGPQRATIDRRERRGGARREATVARPEPGLGSPATAPVELSAS